MKAKPYKIDLSAAKPTKPDSRLTEGEVWRRLESCTKLDVVNELYSLGQSITKEVVDSIRVLESKAISFAAYGAGIITLLVSGSALWSKSVNQWVPWVVVSAALCALICTVFSVQAIILQRHENISADDWLKEKFLDSELDIKRYHILTMWGSMNSYLNVHDKKVAKIKYAQYFLIFSALILMIFLLSISVFRNDSLSRNCSVSSVSWISFR
jgi:hypothetical protein